MKVHKNPPQHFGRRKCWSRASSHPDWEALRLHYRRSRNSTRSTVSRFSPCRGSRTITAGSEFHRPRSTLYCA